MSVLDDRPTTDRPRRAPRALVNLAWVGLGILITWGLLANPLGLSSLDGLRHRLLGDHPAASAEAPREHAGLWTCGMHPEVIQEPLDWSG